MYPQSEMRVSFRWSLCILRREPEVRATSSVHNGTPHRDHTGLVAAEARLGSVGALRVCRVGNFETMVFAVVARS